MRLVVGLGNPGKEYEKTRHNAGFMVIAKLLDELHLKLDNKKFNALYTIYRKGSEKIVIMEPQTYMNGSGQAVEELMHYYDIDPEDLLVIHDDLDLPVGKLRLRTSGSSGGQKGMGDIINHLGTKDIKRIRLGVSHDRSVDTKDYVLGTFSKEDAKIFDEACERAKNAVICSFDEDDFQKVMNKFNG